ncbi:metallophosphoesterase [Psychrobacillus sp. MER TA 171]|uniref:metallophosphoesterase n=1 Tax=Psychrobacillus sp. MER TA 171 TaxID=2939577 RepID=UPI002041F26B|nr:metallophosphoesterase [Psychrobacillus sp. MER TA 171]
MLSIGITIVIAGIILFLYMLFLAFQTNVKEHQLLVKEMPKATQLNILFISDIHRRKIDDTLIHSIIGKVDLVIIGGDLTEKGVPLMRTKFNLKQLKKLGPVYYVFGNNDREVGESNLVSIFQELDIQILNNTSVTISEGKIPIRLVGINDGFVGKVSIADAFNLVEEKDIIIFVSHAPAFFHSALKVSKPRLMLAGHLHGGQIRIGPIGIYEKGSYRLKENRAELISNGFGTTGVPLRLGAKSECHIITLHNMER